MRSPANRTVVEVPGPSGPEGRTDPVDPEELPAAVVQLLVRRGLTVATAESLTAGLLAAALAEVPGASGTLQGGVVAYQNQVKEQLLRVDPDLLARAGAVDAEVARQMAEGVRRATGADVGLSTTGVAGPDAHQGKPVGTVYVGLAGLPGQLAPEAVRLSLHGDREAIRRETVRRVLQAVQTRLTGSA